MKKLIALIALLVASSAIADATLTMDTVDKRTDGSATEGVISYRLYQGNVVTDSEIPNFTIDTLPGSELCASAIEQHAGFSMESAQTCITMRNAPVSPTVRRVTVTVDIE